MLRWYFGSEPAEERPRAFDVLRHPVTGSSYKVLATGAAEPGGVMKVWLEGLGSCVEPEDEGARTIFYAVHPHGGHVHRDA
ncbi:MAG TPA: hypothetical protein VGV69_01120 [Solirubrobacterales bacterium]|nr:hypothetical protein [Solirubrobacterales bacterium]